MLLLHVYDTKLQKFTFYADPLTYYLASSLLMCWLLMCSDFQTRPLATHRTGVIDIAKLPWLNVSSIAIKIYKADFAYRIKHTCSVVWRMCFYFYNKGRTVVPKLRKKHEICNFFHFPLSCKICSAALRIMCCYLHTEGEQVVKSAALLFVRENR